MQKLNPLPGKGRQRPLHRLCSGQVLLCRSLGIRVKDWDQKTFDIKKFFLEDVGEGPSQIVLAPRMGIPKNKGHEKLLRFIDLNYLKSCTKNPLTQRNWMNSGPCPYEVIKLEI